MNYVITKIKKTEVKWNFLPYCDKEEWEIKTRDIGEANMATAAEAAAAAAAMMKVETDVTAEQTAAIMPTD